MKFNFENIIMNILMWLVLLATLISLSACGTRKKESRTKLETVNQIEQSQAVKSSQTEIKTASLLNITKLNISFSPVDETKPMQFINGKDTITTVNASIKINNEVDKSEINKTEKTTTNEADKVNKQTQRQNVESDSLEIAEEKKGNPWNWVAIIATTIFSLAIVGYFYFKGPSILNKIKNIFIS